ncbi:Ger(x)C family spore germination protein [Desmospora activa]|uniref:Spore germination protein KC n=1 Tax=Desmospora activa DSM 45169 TaxID=1121389 RepID=A0A2T4ZB68_9BACL|nr:Ger(x)C family spore germination protein [Desmospora activa]PTM59131.1 spore germination protein KC [Desmospora activa DSM 45169]
MHLHKWVVLVVILSLLPGCWDAREIENRSSVVATAIDTHPQGYEVTVQIPVPMKIAGSGGQGGSDGGQGAVDILSAHGSTLSDAFDKIRYQSNQDIFFGNNRLVLIGEKLAKRGIDPMLDFIRRSPEVRRRQWTVVVKGKAKDSLRVNTKLEQIPMEYILSMLEEGIKDGIFLREGLNDFLEDLTNPAKDPALNYLAITNGQIKWLGLALFHGEKMKGLFDRKVTRAVIQVKYGDLGESTDASCVKVPGEIVFDPKKLKRNITTHEVDGKPKIRVEVEVEGKVVERDCNMRLDEPKNLAILEKSIKREYEVRTRHAIKRAQKLGTDVFNFGDIIRTHHPRLWKKIDWNKEFPRVDVDVVYHVVIRRIGMQAR